MRVSSFHCSFRSAASLQETKTEAFCPQGSTKVCRVYASKSSADSCQHVSPRLLFILRWFRVVQLCCGCGPRVSEAQVLRA